MLPGTNRFSAATAEPEGPFPLGPFPRHTWIHNNTPEDSLDEACHEIWKRVQRLSEELQDPSLLPQLHALCSDLSETLRRDSVDSQSSNYLLDEPEGVESLYTEIIGNREKERKLRALCDAQLSAKSVITSLLSSTKSCKNSTELEDSSMTGTCGMEGSKPEVSLPLKYTDRGAGSRVPAEETQVVKEFTQTSTTSSATSSTAPSSTAAARSQATGEKQQLPPFAKTCRKMDSNTVTKDTVTTATPHEESIQHNTSTSDFSTTSTTAALNQPVWQNLSFPPFSILPNHLNYPQFQVALYSAQQIVHPPYAPMLNYTTLVQPSFSYQQITPHTLSSNIQDKSLMAGDGFQYLFSPSFRFSSTPGGAVMSNLNYFASKSHVKF